MAMESPAADKPSNAMSEEQLREMAELAAQVESVSLDLPQDLREPYLESRDSIIHARKVGSLSTKGRW